MHGAMRNIAHLYKCDRSKTRGEDWLEENGSLQRQWTPLHWASCKGRIDVARMLVERRADVCV